METLVKSLEEKLNKFERRLNTVRPIMLNLDEKFNKLEKRINIIEEYVVKNKEIELNAQQVLSEGTEIINNFKLLEEQVYANKEVLSKIENDSKRDQSLEPVEHENSTQKGKNDERRCKFWNAGYCKFKKDCQFSHPVVICSVVACLDKSCRKRHPKPCKNLQ